MDRNMHRLLNRQLRKAFGPDSSAWPKLPDMFRLVSDAYQQYDDHLDMLDRSMELSSRELVQRNAEMRAVFQSFPDTFLWVDMEGTILDVKGGMSDVVNLMPREFVGRKIWEIPIACGRDKCRKVMGEMAGSDGIVQSEYSVELGGKTLFYEARLMALPEDTVLVILRNITQGVRERNKREQAEQQLRDIIDFLPDATFVVDRDKRVIAWNKATELMTGVPKEEVLGKGEYEYALPFYGERRPVLLDLLDKDEEELREKYDYVERQGDSLVTEVFVPFLKEGIYLWATASLLRDGEGRVTGAIESVRDITARKLRERESTVLFRISSAAGACESIQEFLKAIHEVLMEYLWAENFYVALEDAKRDLLTFPYYSDQKDEFLDMAGISSLNPPSPTLVVLRTGRPLHISGRDWLAAVESGDMSVVGTPSNDWLGVPLVSKGRVLGVMTVQHYDRGQSFSREDERLLEAVAEQVARALERLEAEEALKASEAKYRSIFESASWGIFQTTADGEMLSANPALATIFGYTSPEDMVGRIRVNDLYADPDDRVRLMRDLEHNDVVRQFDFTGRRRDGGVVLGILTVHGVRDESGAIVRIEGALEDATEKRRAQAALEEQKANFRQLFENSPLAIVLVDPDGAVRDVNQAFVSLFGFSRKEVVDLDATIVPERFREESRAFLRASSRGEALSEETVRRHKSGRELDVSLVSYPFVHQGEVAGSFIIYRDISAQKAYEQQLSHQALHDDLTGLPNRALFMERLRRAMDRRRRNQDQIFAVLLVDLDEFKRVNDSMGHVTGDRVLIEVARRLKESVRRTDTVARLGGDEFGIILEEYRSPGEAIKSVRRMHGRLGQPCRMGQAEVVLSASTGVVIRTQRYEHAEDILRDADISMYRAKELGKNRFKVFDKGLHQQVLEAVRVESELRRAIPGGELFLVYQPIHAIGDGSIKGFEALVRWDHPELGVIGPAEFIPVAEDTGLIVDLGVWVLTTACEQLKEWSRRPGNGGLTLSINISAKHFSQPDMVRTVARTIRDLELPKGRLTIEITETAIMDTPDTALRKLEQLKRMGLRISVDDFGTGYSSLAYLQRLPVDVLKLDRSFIRHMSRDSQSLEIVRAVILLGHSLQLSVVAEGVETVEQYEWLKAMDCDLGQGFLFNRPLSREKADRLVGGEGN